MLLSVATLPVELKLGGRGAMHTELPARVDTLICTST